MTHFLVITERGSEWEIEHEESCPTETWTPGLGNVEVTDYTCNVGVEISNVGLDSLADWESLDPGRYPIRHVIEHTPSLPTNGGAETDAWLEIIEE